MEEEIKKKIDNLRHEVENLIIHYDSEKQTLSSASFRAGSDVISRGFGYITEMATESREWGRLGRKVSKAALDDQRKQNLKLLDERYSRLLATLIQRVKGDLSDISIIRKSDSTPNTDGVLVGFIFGNPSVGFSL